MPRAWTNTENYISKFKEIEKAQRSWLPLSIQLPVKVVHLCLFFLFLDVLFHAIHVRCSTNWAMKPRWKQVLLQTKLDHSSVGWALHRYHGAHGFKSRWSLKKKFLCNFKLFHNCEDHFHVYSLLFALRRHSFHRSSILARFHFTENVANVSRLHFRFHFVFAHPHKNDTARHCACVILLRGLGPMSCDRFLIGITQAFLKLPVLLLAFLAFLRMRNNVYNVPRFNENKVLLYYPSTKIGSTVVNLYHFQLERKPLQ